MKEIKTRFGRVRVAFQRCSNLTKVMIIATIVLCMGTLITLRFYTDALKSRNEALHQKAAELEQQNSELNDKIADIGSVQSVEDIAGEELGLVHPDTVVFQPES